MKYMLTLLALLSLYVTSAVVAQQAVVKIAIEPQTVLIERSATSQAVSFDFSIENTGPDPIRIAKIELSIYDPSGNLELRKFLGSSNLRHGDYEIARLEPKSSSFLFNPFETFSMQVSLAKMQYTFFFEANDGKKEFSSSVTITPAEFKPKTRLQLPLKGRLLVHDGHDFYSHHRRFNLAHPFLREIGVTHNFTRYASDLCIVNERGDLRRNASDENTDWYGFGAKVYAPGSGRVIRTRSESPDNIKGESTFTLEEFRKDPTMPAGNFIIIDHLNGEFSLMAHLKRGSVLVREGEMVHVGQQLAEMGVSGDAYLPHVHYELRSAGVVNALGLPAYFWNFVRVLGPRKLSVTRGPVDSGDILLNK